MENIKDESFLDLLESYLDDESIELKKHEDKITLIL